MNTILVSLTKLASRLQGQLKNLEKSCNSQSATYHTRNKTSLQNYPKLVEFLFIAGITSHRAVLLFMELEKTRHNANPRLHGTLNAIDQIYRTCDFLWESLKQTHGKEKKPIA